MNKTAGNIDESAKFDITCTLILKKFKNAYESILVQNKTLYMGFDGILLFCEIKICAAKYLNVNQQPRKPLNT